MSQESTLRLRSGRASSGQVIIILLLVMVVALAIGLAVVGRSITEISTSTNSENSSRAFSAAEAGMEGILYDSSLPGFTNYSGDSNTSLTNNSAAKVNWNTNMPPTGASVGASVGVALEYPPFGIESFAQFWLANPQTDPPSAYYTAPSFDLYFGDPDPDPAYVGNDSNYPAIEVRVIYSDGSSIFKVFDSQPPEKQEGRSKFAGCDSKGNLPLRTNNNAVDSYFLCRVRITGLTASPYPVMVRVRMLYTATSHPVALAPTSGDLPFQAKIFDSKGTAGNVQRNLKVFQEEAVMPHIFDYAVFSLGTVGK